MELIVETNYQTGSCRIYLQSEARDGFRSMWGMVDGKLIEQTLDMHSGEIVPVHPLIELPRQLADAFFHAMADHLSNRNIKTKNEHQMEGRLAATEKHLEDMREMAKTMLKELTTPPTQILAELKSTDKR